jgi:hypothetical protein
MGSPAGGWAGMVSEILEDLSTVAVSHLRLARQEAGDQARDALKAGVLMLAGAFLLQSAILILVATTGLLVGRWLGDPFLGLLAAAILLVGLGTIILLMGRSKIKGIRPLAETLEELGESRRWMQDELFPRLRKNARN